MPQKDMHIEGVSCSPVVLLLLLRYLHPPPFFFAVTIHLLPQMYALKVVKVDSRMENAKALLDSYSNEIELLKSLKENRFIINLENSEVPTLNLDRIFCIRPWYRICPTAEAAGKRNTPFRAPISSFNGVVCVVWACLFFTSVFPAVSFSRISCSSWYGIRKIV